MYNQEQLQNGNKATNNANNANNANNNKNVNNDKNSNNNTTIHLVRNFLDTKTETVLTIAAATAIAFAFKDLVLSIITNIVHPLIVKVILLMGINKYISISELNTSQNIVSNLSSFIINVFSFILILVITYYLFNIIINSN